jgi:hypothetical protein
MKTAKQGTTAGQRDKEFPTEWTIVDEGTSAQEKPKKKKADSKEDTETVKAPLAARSHA